MQKSIETTGVNRDAAIEKALMQLGLERDDVSVEVLDNGKKGFFGIGSAPARVRVTYEVPDEPAPAPAPAAKEPKKETPPPEHRPKPETKHEAKPETKPEPKPVQSRPDFSGIDPNDPRLSTPHLVKAAPPKAEAADKPEKSDRPDKTRS